MAARANRPSSLGIRSSCLFMRPSKRIARIGPILATLVLTTAACGGAGSLSAGVKNKALTSAEHGCSNPVNSVWYVTFIEAHYEVELTKKQVSSIARTYYSCPLNESDAEAIRSQIASMYTYDPSDLNGGMANEIVEALQDTYGEDGISLSDSQLTSLVGQYLSSCVPLTTDGFNPDSLQCLSSIQPEIQAAAQAAS